MGCFIQTTCQDLSQKLHETGRRRNTQNDLSWHLHYLFCCSAVEHMDGGFVLQEREDDKCSQPVSGALLGGRFIAASDCFEDRGKELYLIFGWYLGSLDDEFLSPSLAFLNV